MTLPPSALSRPICNGRNPATRGAESAGDADDLATAAGTALPDLELVLAVFDLPGCTYVQCRRCQAPMVSPLPNDWLLDLFKVGLPQGPADTYVMAHRPGCAAPEPDMAPETGVGLRLPGSCVTQLWPAPREGGQP